MDNDEGERERACASERSLNNLKKNYKLKITNQFLFICVIIIRHCSSLFFFLLRLAFFLLRFLINLPIAAVHSLFHLREKHLTKIFAMNWNGTLVRLL